MLVTADSKRKIGGVRSANAPPRIALGPVAPAHDDFIYNGGPVLANPILYPTFWGSSWADAPHQAQAARLVEFLKDLISSDWMNVLTQYGVGPGNGGSQVMPLSYIASLTATISDSQVHLIIQAAINSGTLPEPPSNNTTTALLIYLDETVAVQDVNLNIVMCEPFGDNAFGYHNFFKTARGNNCYYAVVPALDDSCIQRTCPGGCSLKLNQTQEQRRTQVTSHELAEMLTDPELPTGWFGPTSDENGDICNGQSATITLGANTWTVQRIYSKSDDIKTGGADFCLASAPFPIPPLRGGPTGGPIGWAVALSSAVTGACNSDGRLEMFVVGMDNAVWHNSQTVPHDVPWSGWASLGGVVTSEPSVALNTDGQLEVFARGTDNAVWHNWQTAPHNGPWSGWSSLGGNITSAPAAVVNTDGRLELFARGTDSALWHIWQTAAPSGSWSAWESLGGVITSNPAVGVNSDGRLEVFARGTDSALWYIWQTVPNGLPWSTWSSLFGIITSDPVVPVNADGRLEAFARGIDNALWHIWQTVPHEQSWSGWNSLGGILITPPASAS